MKNVLLLLSEGFEIYEASAFIDVIGWNLISGDKSTKLFTCGLRHEIKSTFGIKISLDYLVEEINVDDFCAIAIPGGFEEYNFYKDAYDERFFNLISEFHKRDKIIASICTGAFPIAKSGILKDRNGTTYNMLPVRHQTLRSMGVNVLNQPIVIDQNIITSWNPSTALNVGLLLLEKLTNKKNSDHIKKIMGFV